MPTPQKPPPPDHRSALGSYGERVAVRALTDAGFSVLDRNWRCRDGELDVVARDGDALVFCEVKTRTGTGFGHPAEAVTPASPTDHVRASAIRTRSADA